MNQSLPSSAELRDEIRQELASKREQIKQLETALIRIRSGRVSKAVSDRLSDTDMARIADEALIATELGGATSPFVQQVLGCVVPLKD